DIKKEVTVMKIIEGWDTNDIAEHLERKGLASKEEFLQTVGRPQKNYNLTGSSFGFAELSDDYGFLKSKPDSYGLEGYLFPDTYEVYKDASAKEAVVKMLNNFDKKLTEKMKKDIQERGRTVHEIITMASLAEKEAQTEEEMKIVAGIFWDRINQEKPLQSCATLAYALGKDKVQYSGLDTNIDSPYNTYKHKGLPPTPISNPGLQAIKAAIYPKETDYQYFLSPVGSDKTLFSKTYREHQRKKAKYVD
ncbi:MAG TPA: endolytic transglycosylase MltG, partial [Patescibacteria group bacterium]|nr:endolytic transglycosylase MltG [Patescibacteria group bacterium]